MSELARFLREYWNQDADIVFGTVEKATKEFRVNEGRKSHGQLVKEVNTRFLNGEFNEDSDGFPIYESRIHGTFSGSLSADDARKVLEVNGLHP